MGKRLIPYELPSGFHGSTPKKGENDLITFIREEGFLPCVEFGQCDCDPWPDAMCKQVYVFPIDQPIARAFAMIELGLVQYLGENPAQRS